MTGTMKYITLSSAPVSMTINYHVNQSDNYLPQMRLGAFPI